MRLIKLMSLLLLCTMACKNSSDDTSANKEEKFDKIKWLTKEGNTYPYRDAMLKDLIDNYLVHGLKKDDLLDMLGEPNRTNEGHLYYTLTQTHFANLPVPLRTKTLVVKLTKDNTVEWRKIHGK